LLLLTGAGLVLKSLWLMHGTSASFSPERVLVSTLDVRQAANRTRYIRDLVHTLEAVPGVEAAAVWNPGHQQAAVRFPEVADLPQTAENVAEIVHVTAHHLAASGIQLRAGRWIDDVRDATARAAVVNLALQRRYKALLPTPEAALGKSFLIGRQQFVIVGVVSDYRPRPDVDAKPLVYLPLGEFPNLSEVQLLVRSSANPLAISGAVRESVSRNPEVNMTGSQTLSALMSGPIAPRRFEAGLLLAFAALALVLAMIGVYGIVNYAVSERTQELGVRIALGATARHVLRIVLRRILTIVATGASIGIIGSLSLGRLMDALLYGVKPSDLTTYIMMSSLLIVAAALAAYLPARRALRIDPIEALRHEG
jgi:ABC-type antimicrobial peptide transport system permease subunit